MSTVTTSVITTLQCTTATATIIIKFDEPREALERWCRRRA